MIHIDPVDPYTYAAARRVLHAKGWDRDLPGTARRIAEAVVELHSAIGEQAIRKAIDYSDFREPLVIGLLASVNVAVWGTARPLFHEAVIECAKVILARPHVGLSAN